jgi:hypothetical protein
VLDRGLRLAKECFRQRAEVPCPGQVRIEHETPIDHRSAVIEVADDHDEGKPCRTERDRVIPPQICGPPGQAFCFGGLLCAIGHPAKPFALQVAARGHAMGRSKIVVELNSTVEQRQRFLISWLCKLMKSGHAAQKIVVGVEALGRLALCPLNLGLF